MLHLITARLTLRELVPADAAFLAELLQEPGFLRWIGDRGVRNEADALRYLEDGPRASYAEHGHGLLAIERRSDGERLGIAGLLRRAGPVPPAPPFEGPDLGFALLSRFQGQGYAGEAARALLAAGAPNQAPILAIANVDNERSIRLLEELDFRFERMQRLDPDGPELAVFRWDPLDGVSASDAAAVGEYTCPSCGETIVIPLDLAEGEEQRYVEDCPVCCSPNVIYVALDAEGLHHVHAEAE